MTSCNYKTLDQTGRVDNTHSGIVMTPTWGGIGYPQQNFNCDTLGFGTLSTAYNNNGNGCNNGHFVQGLCGAKVVKENYGSCKKYALYLNGNYQGLARITGEPTYENIASAILGMGSFDVRAQGGLDVLFRSGTLKSGYSMNVDRQNCTIKFNKGNFQGSYGIYSPTRPVYV